MHYIYRGIIFNMRRCEMLLTPKEVAEELRVSKQSVSRWLRSGKLKGVKAGTLWRVKEEDLQEFIKEGNNEGV